MANVPIMETVRIRINQVENTTKFEARDLEARNQVRDIHKLLQAVSVIRRERQLPEDLRDRLEWT